MVSETSEDRLICQSKPGLDSKFSQNRIMTKKKQKQEIMIGLRQNVIVYECVT